MHAALARLIDGTPPPPAAIDAFLAAHDFPLIDRDGATFVFRGTADRVLLQHWVFGLPSAQPFEPVPHTDLWTIHLPLPAGSRIEYKFEVVHNGHGEWLRDPLNPHQARDPFGSNSICAAFGYERPDWTFPDPQARPGLLDDGVIDSRAFGEPRPVRVYLPARFRRSGQYPLLVIHDGDDFLRYADLKAVLDNLIHRLEIPPLIALLTQTPHRIGEYPNHPGHARFLAEEVLPWVRARFPVIDEPQGRCMMGASFGAVASLSTAWRYQGLFGKLCLLSGSFAFTDIGDHWRGEVFEPVVRFTNAFRAHPGRPAEQIYLACGTYESLIYENRSMVPFLQSRGLSVRFEEARDGHNWENWRDRLRAGLSWLYPGPLWMVYE